MTSEPIFFGSPSFPIFVLVIVAVLWVVNVTNLLSAKNAFTYLLIIIPSIYAVDLVQVFYFRHGLRGLYVLAGYRYLLVSIWIYGISILLLLFISFRTSSRARRISPFFLVFCLACDFVWFRLSKSS